MTGWLLSVRQWFTARRAARRERERQLIVEERDRKHAETCAEIDRENARRLAEGWPKEILQPHPSRYNYDDGL